MIQYATSFLVNLLRLYDFSFPCYIGSNMPAHGQPLSHGNSGSRKVTRWEVIATQVLT